MVGATHTTDIRVIQGTPTEVTLLLRPVDSRRTVRLNLLPAVLLRRMAQRILVEVTLPEEARLAVADRPHSGPQVAVPRELASLRVVAVVRQAAWFPARPTVDQGLPLAPLSLWRILSRWQRAVQK